MLGIDLKVSYAGENEEVVIVTVSGYIDTTTAPELDKLLEEQFALDRYKIIVDLENVDYISSAGWGVFVSGLKDLREHNGDIVLTHMAVGVHNIFELMEFSSIIKDFEDVEQALVYFLGIKASDAKLKAALERIKLRDPVLETGQPEASAAKNSQPATRPTSAEVPHITSAMTDKMQLTRDKFGRRLVRLVIDKPYLRVKDMVKALRSPEYGRLKCKKRDVKRELKTLGLFTEEQRYNLALKSKSSSQ